MFPSDVYMSIAYHTVAYNESRLSYTKAGNVLASYCNTPPIYCTYIHASLSRASHQISAHQLSQCCSSAYRIVETFEEENFRGSVGSEHFAEKKFHRMLNHCVDMPKFSGENFHVWISNRKIREGFLPWKFPAIWYKSIIVKLVIHSISNEQLNIRGTS
jgi:hypothetical protein